jgi:lipoprotein-anchoring transpeptidase ErfK/SrfK
MTSSPTIVPRIHRRRALAALGAAALFPGCATAPLEPEWPTRDVLAAYGEMDAGAFVVPAIPTRHLTPESARQLVPFWTDEPPGSIVVDPYSYFLYLVMGNDTAVRYRVGVGAAGRTFAGRATVGRKQEWPYWTPTANMIRVEPALYGPWAGGMAPGLQNPLGARAMYLYRNGRDSMYRIHGTYEPGSIGNSQSAGCIRMFQQDAMHLYAKVQLGARVRVLGPSETGLGTSPSRPA